MWWSGYRRGASIWSPAKGLLFTHKTPRIGLIRDEITSAASLQQGYVRSFAGSLAQAFEDVRGLGDSPAEELDGCVVSYDSEKTALGGVCTDGQPKTGSPGRTIQTGKLSKLLMKRNRHASIMPALKQWLHDGNPLPKNIAVVALTNLKRDHRYKQALELAEYVWKEKLFETTDVDHTYRLYLTSQVGSIKDVEYCFAKVPLEYKTEMLYNQLISSYLSRGMLTEALSALENLKSSGQLVSALPYNQFIAFYRHRREQQKALEVIQDMKAVDINPNTRTYNMLMTMFLKQDDDVGVFKIYNEMKREGVAPDALTFSLVAKANVASGMVEEAETIAAEMGKVAPDNCHLTHDLLLSLYAEQGKLEELQKLWKRLQSFSNLSARSYGVMIESLGKLGLVKEAEKIAIKAEMKKGILGPRVFNAMMCVYARHGKVQDAESLLARILNDRSRPSSVTYLHVISCYLKVGQLDKALEYLKIARENLSYDHSKPWFTSFLLVLECIAERGEIETAEHIFEVYTASGSYHNTLVYNTLLKAYLKAKKPAVNYLQRMSTDGVQPDAETLTLLAEIEYVSGEPVERLVDV